MSGCTKPGRGHDWEDEKLILAARPTTYLEAEASPKARHQDALWDTLFLLQTVVSRVTQGKSPTQLPFRFAAPWALSVILFILRGFRFRFVSVRAACEWSCNGFALPLQGRTAKICEPRVETNASNSGQDLKVPGRGSEGVLDRLPV